MCGICGVLPYRAANVNKEDIKQQMAVMLRMNEVRGDEATGIFIGSSPQPRICKSNMKASLFVTSEAYESAFQEGEFLPVIGHTRKSTIGQPDNNHNNHPLYVGPFVAIHNGSLRNKIEPDHIPGSVDSRYFPWVLNEKHRDRKPSIQDLRSLIKSLEGTFALCWTDLRNPDIYFLIRDEVEERAVYAIDTGKYFRFTQIYEKGLTEIEPHTLLTINVSTGKVETNKFNYRNVPDELIEFIDAMKIPKDIKPKDIKSFLKRKLEEEYQGAKKNTAVSDKWSGASRRYGGFDY